MGESRKQGRFALGASMVLHLVLVVAVIVLAWMPEVYSLSEPGGGGGGAQVMAVELISPPASAQPPREKPRPTPAPIVEKKEEPKPEEKPPIREKQPEKPVETKPATPPPTPEPKKEPEKTVEKATPKPETPKPAPTKAPATPAPTPVPKKTTARPTASATPAPTKTPFVLSPDRARDLRGTPKVPTRETPKPAAGKSASLHAPANPGPSSAKPLSRPGAGSNSSSSVASAGGGAVGAGNGASSLKNIGLPDYYVTNALNALAKHFRVPPTDQKEVTALVQCRINNDGTITNIVLKKSCGDSSLDALATEALERARRFPPFPDDFTKSYVDVEISFFYMQ